MDDHGFPNLPNVPMDLPDIGGDNDNTLLGNNLPNRNDNDEIDFDDLSKRFEELKKRK